MILRVFLFVYVYAQNITTTTTSLITTTAQPITTTQIPSTSQTPVVITSITPPRRPDITKPSVAPTTISTPPEPEKKPSEDPKTTAKSIIIAQPTPTSAPSPLVATDDEPSTKPISVGPMWVMIACAVLGLLGGIYVIHRRSKPSDSLIDLSNHGLNVQTLKFNSAREESLKEVCGETGKQRIDDGSGRSGNGVSYVNVGVNSYEKALEYAQTYSRK